MASAVQQQMRDGYATLTQARSRGAASSDLAAAYGRMGKLPLAAEIYDVARLCFENAQLLVPADDQWSYYLGRLHSETGNPAAAVRSYETAAGLNPGNVVTMLRLGDGYLALGRPEAAEPLDSDIEAELRTLKEAASHAAC